MGKVKGYLPVEQSGIVSDWMQTRDGAAFSRAPIGKSLSTRYAVRPLHEVTWNSSRLVRQPWRVSSGKQMAISPKEWVKVEIEQKFNIKAFLYSSTVLFWIILNHPFFIFKILLYLCSCKRSKKVKYGFSL